MNRNLRYFVFLSAGDTHTILEDIQKSIYRRHN